MYVEDVGAGEVVLLLHGTPSPVEDLAPLRDALSSDHRVLVPHLPGFGRSPPAADTGYATTAQTLVDMLHDRRVDRLAAIVGYSNGVHRALDLVLRHDVAADRVIGLAGVAWTDDELRAALLGGAAALQSDAGLAALRAAMPPRWLSDRWRELHPTDESRVAAWLDLTSHENLIAELEAQTRAPDLRPLLPNLAPRLYLRVGALDVACPPAWSEIMAGLAPNAELVIVRGVAHALLVEDAQPTIDWVVATVAAPLG